MKITTAGVVTQIAGILSYGGSSNVPAAYYMDSPLDALGNAHPFSA